MATSVDSLIAVDNAALNDDICATSTYSVDCMSDLKVQESFSDLSFQISSQPQVIITELSNMNAMGGGIPNKIHLIDDDNETHSCITTSTISGIASVCSWAPHGEHDERDEPENGPHMLFFTNQ
jgi:hypothetical protein